MKKMVVLVAFMAIGIGFLMAHPIKMSIGKVLLDTKTKHINIVINFYADDFDAFFNQKYPTPPLNVNNPGQYEKGIILSYINNHFQLKIDDAVLTIRLVEIVNTADGVRSIKLESSFAGMTNPKSLTLINTLLFDAYRAQSNVIHVVVDGHNPMVCQFKPDDYTSIVQLK